ncbi:MAG: hypothetical protein IKU87_00935 [Clostridia bacterium]|nr:hypothetical protein [Clostridia bacterium]
MKQIISTALIYCGTVFGAGFASGQEIASFFASNHLLGVVASAVSGLLFSFFGGVICYDGAKYNLNNSGEYFKHLYPSRISSLLGIIVTSFLAVSFCIMIAGCGELFYEQFFLRPVFGALLSLALCYKIIKNKVSGLAFLNKLVTPIMILGTLLLCVLIIMGRGNAQVILRPELFKNSVFSGILYISYNCAVSAPVLISCAAKATTRKNAMAGGVLGGIIIAILLFLLSFVLALFPESWASELPFFFLSGNVFPVLKPFCAFVLYFAMITTAASSGVSVLSQVKSERASITLIGLCGAAFFSSFISFGALVKTMYTAFGVSGLILIFGILKQFFRKSKKTVLKERN